MFQLHDDTIKAKHVFSLFHRRREHYFHGLSLDASHSCMKSIAWNVNETITGRRRPLIVSFYEREHGFVSPHIFYMHFLDSFS